ncbi:unnamed protein product, partial [Allacma fusca]
CSSLKRVEILMPTFVRRGGEVRFTCKYDIDVGSLYAVKWYKGSQEFYRYVPKEVPPIKVFPQPGVRVVVSNEEFKSFTSICEIPVDPCHLSSNVILIVAGERKSLPRVL